MLYSITHARGHKACQHLVESKYHGFVTTARVWGWSDTHAGKGIGSFLPLPFATRGTKNEEDLSLRPSNILKGLKEWRGKGSMGGSEQVLCLISTYTSLYTPSPPHPFRGARKSGHLFNNPK